MSWNAYNRRQNALREVLAVVDSRRDDSLNAFTIIAESETARAAFGTAAELMLDAQMAWYQRLSGQLDRAWTEGAHDREDLVINAWREAATQMPSARALIDANDQMPELQRALANERVLLARSAGLYSHELEATGERLRAAAKAQVVEVPETPDAPAGLFSRIREALAA